MCLCIRQKWEDNCSPSEQAWCSLYGILWAWDRPPEPDQFQLQEIPCSVSSCCDHLHANWCKDGRKHSFKSRCPDSNLVSIRHLGSCTIQTLLQACTFIIPRGSSSTQFQKLTEDMFKRGKAINTAVARCCAEKEANS